VQHPVLHLLLMPTTKPRHTITETGRAADALDRARAVGVDDIRELVVLGAEAAVARAAERREHDDRRRRLRERLMGRIERRGGIDADAAREAREGGWM
jgi:hypothetical protein